VKLAQVIGNIVATRKEATLDGLRLMLLQPTDASGKAAGAPLVAADAVGAGVGELVLFAAGSSARQTEVTNNRPVDAVIMAIIDSVAQDGKAVFSKDG
jgi:microcompartment protein CcmK/EutM